MRTFALILLTALAGPAAGREPPDPAARARQVLKAHCHRCHNGPGSSSGYEFDVTRHDTLVKPADGEPWVTGHSLVKSPLWDAVQKRMPQRGAPERAGFGDAERAAVRAWIEAGAPPFPAAAERPFVPLNEVLAAVRDRLNRADRADRPYLRFFTLTHMHNNPAFDDEDLRYARAALSKVLNSLSWKAQLVLPEAADRHGTVFAVDVRALDWDRAGLWDRVTDAYPYGLKFGSHPDRELKELDREIVRLTGSALPWVRADWFVAAATRPPLYHDLLQLPKSAKALEEKLGVSVADNFRRDKLARAGFPKSGVSGQNRMVERHPAAYGAYWKSYDFLPETGRANLTRFPLGPDLDPQFKDQAFKHDGGEVIFHLPNGLQGYMLVNGRDERIDAGPVEIVSDDKRVAGTPVIVNGVSCMACHQHGMIPFRDTVREGSAVFGEPHEKVLRLYRKPAEMDELVAADRQKFLDALDKAVGPFLRAGADKTPVTRFKEPVSEVAPGYRRGYLDLRTAAAELYLKDPQDLVTRVGQKRLKELGLEPLARPGGLVPRYQWEAVDGETSLMQHAARALGFTTVN